MQAEAGKRPSSNLGPAVVAYLRQDGAEVAVAAGAVVVRRGDPGEYFWVVLEGELEVRLTGEDGEPLSLARLGAGGAFGEMAIMTGDPVSADVVALGPARLLRCPAARFRSALGESEELRTGVFANLARALRGTSAEAWHFHRQAKALNVVIGRRRDEGPIVAESGAMRTVAARVAELAASPGPLLVTGPPGAGKRFHAVKVHEAAGGDPGALISVDCRSLAAADAMAFLFGSASGLGTGGAAGEEGAALRGCGALQLADGGTLVLRHAERLARPVRAEVARLLVALATGDATVPAVRVAVTTRLAPEGFAAAAPELAPALLGRELAVPPLSGRRRDIAALARLFLAQRGGEGATAREIDRDAEHALVSLRYSHRNARELREAVEMAALIADGPSIRAEHVFAGPKGRGTVHEADLTARPLVRRLTAPRVLAAARGATLAVFAALVAAALMRPGEPAGALANSLVWGVWEPALFVAFIVLGRLWCTVCPLSTAGRLAARLGCRGGTPGPRLKAWSPWLVAGGFLLIIWVEHAFDMKRAPRAGAVLLLALLAAAVAFAVLYRRETWCRYVCPLGNLGAVLAPPAVLAVRSNPDVCATSCTTHECFKGSATEPGCPVFHHPLYASDAHTCKLCFRCLRACPHGSARLFLRPPLQGVWAQAELGDGLVPFALFLVVFAPVMLASRGSGPLATTAGFTAAALLALGLAAALRPALGRLLAGPEGTDPGLLARTAFSLLVLAWGPALAFQLPHVPGLAVLRLGAEPGTAVASFLPPAGLPLLPLAQAGAALLAAAGAAVCIAGVRARLRREHGRAGRGRAALLAIGVAYLAATLALVVAQSPAP